MTECDDYRKNLDITDKCNDYPCFHFSRTNGCHMVSERLIKVTIKFLVHILMIMFTIDF